MMLKATDIRRGMVITIDGVNFVVLDFAHATTPKPVLELAASHA